MEFFIFPGLKTKSKEEALEMQTKRGFFLNLRPRLKVESVPRGNKRKFGKKEYWM